MVTLRWVFQVNFPSLNSCGRGRISANLTRDLTRFYVGNPRQGVSDAISLNLSQPLLRGFGSRVAAENLRQAERNVIYAIRDFNHYQNEFAVGKVQDYFRLLREEILSVIATPIIKAGLMRRLDWWNN